MNNFSVARPSERLNTRFRMANICSAWHPTVQHVASQSDKLPIRRHPLYPIENRTRRCSIQYALSALILEWAQCQVQPTNEIVNRCITVQIKTMAKYLSIHLNDKWQCLATYIIAAQVE